eukprot:6225126-Amphidinium_carterae.2
MARLRQNVNRMAELVLMRMPKSQTYPYGKEQLCTPASSNIKMKKIHKVSRAVCLEAKQHVQKGR